MKTTLSKLLTLIFLCIFSLISMNIFAPESPRVTPASPAPAPAPAPAPGTTPDANTRSRHVPESTSSQIGHSSAGAGSGVGTGSSPTSSHPLQSSSAVPLAHPLNASSLSGTGDAPSTHASRDDEQKRTAKARAHLVRTQARSSNSSSGRPGGGSGSSRLTPTPPPSPQVPQAPTSRATVISEPSTELTSLAQDEKTVKLAKQLLTQNNQTLASEIANYDQLKKKIEAARLTNFRATHDWTTHFLTDTSINKRQEELATLQDKLEETRATMNTALTLGSTEETARATLEAKLHLEIEDIKQRQRDLTALQGRRKEKAEVKSVAEARIAPWRVAVADSFVPKAFVGLTNARLSKRENAIPTTSLTTTAGKEARKAALDDIKKLQGKTARKAEEAFKARPGVQSILAKRVQPGSTTPAAAADPKQKLPDTPPPTPQMGDGAGAGSPSGQSAAQRGSKSRRQVTPRVERKLFLTSPSASTLTGPAAGARTPPPAARPPRRTAKPINLLNPSAPHRGRAPTRRL